MSPPEESCLVSRLNHSIIDPELVWLYSDANMSQDSFACLAWATLMMRSAFTHCVIMAFARLSFFFHMQFFVVRGVSVGGQVLELPTAPIISHDLKVEPTICSSSPHSRAN